MEVYGSEVVMQKGRLNNGTTHKSNARQCGVLLLCFYGAYLLKLHTCPGACRQYSIVCGQVRADGVCKGCFTIRCSEFYLITKQSLLCIKRVQVLVFYLYPVCVGSCSGID